MNTFYIEHPLAISPSIAEKNEAITLDPSLLRTGSWIYLLKLGDEIVYVGQTTRLLGRIHAHATDKKKTFDSVEYYEVPNDSREKEEFRLIVKHQPRFNSPSCPASSGMTTLQAIKAKFGSSVDMRSVRSQIKAEQIEGLQFYDRVLYKMSDIQHIIDRHTEACQP